MSLEKDLDQNGNMEVVRRKMCQTSTKLSQEVMKERMSCTHA